MPTTVVKELLIRIFCKILIENWDGVLRVFLFCKQKSAMLMLGFSQCEQVNKEKACRKPKSKTVDDVAEKRIQSY